jgi:CHAT domain-containing protein
MLRVAELTGIPEPVQRDYEKIAKELCSRVWQPISEFVSGKQLVIIAPDGALNMVSFASLVNPQGEYLIEDLAIHYLLSGRDLIRVGAHTDPAEGLFAVADPDFNAFAGVHDLNESDKQPSEQRIDHGISRSLRSGCDGLRELTVYSLPGTRTEVDSIVRRWRFLTDEPVEVCFGTDASEEKFKADAPGNRVIHVATHGFFLACEHEVDRPMRENDSDLGVIGENPLLSSGLFLAGANLRLNETGGRRAEDGILTAYEVSSLNLEGTELVVLSACETGLGEVVEGEGVYGLLRAFQMAGAETVVSALWRVSDRFTADVMSKLYDDNDESLPATMRRLQLAGIRELRDRGSVDHPYSWGAFIAVGNWK